MEINRDSLIQELKTKLNVNPNNINASIITRLNNMRKSDDSIIQKLKDTFGNEYDIHVSPQNNKLHISKYTKGDFNSIFKNGGSKKRTRRHKKQKRTRRHRKH
jgi:hypothetical protein